ncbi:hypothetical protein BH11CYA1_BH11CYA1_33500 [soil metagenome]
MNASNTSNTEIGTISNKTWARCQRKPIPAALLSPFSAGEVISHASVIKLDQGEPSPLSFRPFGELTMEGEIVLALPAVLAWINPHATVSNTSWSWRNAISETLLSGGTVNIDELPPEVLLNRPCLNS